MSRGLNQVTLIGTVITDIDYKEMHEGGTVANFKVATREIWTNWKTGKKEEHYEIHSIAAFNDRAKIAQNIVYKGALIHIGGKNRTKSRMHETGIKLYKTSISVDEFTVLSGPAPEHTQAPAVHQRQHDKYQQKSGHFSPRQRYDDRDGF